MATHNTQHKRRVIYVVSGPVRQSVLENVVHVPRSQLCLMPGITQDKIVKRLTLIRIRDKTG